MRFRPYLALAALLASSSALPSQAATICRLGDGPDTFKVIPWDPVEDGAKVSLSYQARDVVELSEDGRNYLMVGVFVVEAETARTKGAYYISQAGTSGHVHVEAMNLDSDVALPQQDLVLSHDRSQSILPGTYKAGSYHIVGITMGGGSGFGGSSLEDQTTGVTEVSATDLTSCVPLEIDGALHHFDEHDFYGQQVSVPGAGSRKVALTFDSTDEYLVGTVHHEAAGRSYFDISTPSGGGRIANPVAPISSTAGRYTFLADQLGVPARLSLNWLTYSLA